MLTTTYTFLYNINEIKYNSSLAAKMNLVEVIYKNNRAMYLTSKLRNPISKSITTVLNPFSASPNENEAAVVVLPK